MPIAAPLFALGALVAQVPSSFGPSGRFTDFPEDLKRHDVAVVFGTLAGQPDSRTAGQKERKKDRMKPEEAGLGELGTNVVVSGTVFYRIKTTAKIEAAEAFCGHAAAEEKIPVAFEMQAATLPSGEKRRHLLLASGERAALGDETVALFVLEKAPGKPGMIRHVVRFDAKTPEDLAKAKDMAADWYGIHRAKLDLLAAIDAATTLRDRGDKAGAAAALRAALERKTAWRRLESDSVAATALSAAKARANELLRELEKERR